jgi:iron complex outermembrane receptor protein
MMMTSSAIAVTLFGAASAFAQAQASDSSLPATPAASQDGPALSEIVVTGERNNRFGTDVVQAGSFRGAKAIDTPLTVSVIPRAVIEVQQAKNLQDVLQNTAGVTVSQTTPTVYSNLAIRGINVDNRGNYRLNGTLPIINLIDLPLEDKDRVEALKGASALYYGFTSPSGIINLTMKRPTAELYLQADATGDSNGSRGGHVDFGDTIGMFGARINGVYETVDSGIDNTRGTRTLISGAFDFKPAHNLTISLNAEHIFKKVNEPGILRFLSAKTLPAQYQSTEANPYPSVAIPRLLDPSTNFGPDWASNRAEETNILGNIDWKISRAWDLSVSAGTSRLRRDRHFNTLDVTQPSLTTPGEYLLAVTAQPNYHALNRNARIELAGTFDTGPLTHELLVGTAINVRDLYASTSVSVVPVTQSQSYDDPHAIPHTIADPIPSYGAGPTRINDKGIYVFDRVKFHEWLQVLGGARKSDYTESIIGVRDTFKAHPLSYSYGAVIKPVKWVSLYGTYIQGLETTASAPSTTINAGEQLGPAKSTQKEGGVKLQPMSGLLIQAAYFSIDRANTYTNGENRYVLDGRTRYKGAEFSMTGDLTRQLSIYTSVQFLSAKVISAAPTTYILDKSGNQILLNGSPEINPTVKGRDVDNTPHRTASLSLNYKLDQWVPGASVNGGFVYYSRRAIDALNRAYVPGYTLINLGAAYETKIADHSVIFRVNANNITGKRYWASTDADLLAQGAPQVVRFSLGVKY